MADKLAVMADSHADYERLGLSPGLIAVWEDGARTDNSPGTYVWWYFDAHLVDGAKLVVTFMNKDDIAEPHKPLSPVLRLNLDLPDGRHFEKLAHFPLAPGRRRRTTPMYASAKTDSPAISITIGSKRSQRRSQSTSN